MAEHPGYIDHATRVAHEAVPATVLCCPVMGQEYPVTRRCLDEYVRGDLELRWLDPGQPSSMRYGMRDAILEHWTGEQDLIHIDHDTVFIWDNLRDLSNCDSLCCTCAYMSFGQLINAGLGFIKFSAELQQRLDLRDVFMEADLCEDRKAFGQAIHGCYGDWWGLEWHLINRITCLQPEPCVHGQVLNDHSVYGLKPEPVMSVDIHSREGRASIKNYLREQGWTSV